MCFKRTLSINIKLLPLIHFKPFTHKEVEEAHAKKPPKPNQQRTTKPTQAVVLDIMFTVTTRMDITTFPRRPSRHCSTNKLEDAVI